MTLIAAILRTYPQAIPGSSDYGTTDDGLKISNWNAAKLGPKPDEATLIAQAAALPSVDAEKRPRAPIQVYNDINGLVAADQNKLMRAVCAVWMTQNPGPAKQILSALGISIAGDEVAP